MIARALQRIAWAMAVVWAVVTIAFTLNEVVPSDPARLVAGPQARPEEVARLREQMGLGRPVAARYVIFLGRPRASRPPSPPRRIRSTRRCATLGPLHVDLGRSYVQRRPVVVILAERLPRSVALAAAAVLVQTLLGIVLGTFAAAKRRTAWDTMTVAGTLVGASVPAFLVGLALQFLFANRLRWLPMDGFGETTAHQATALVLPALTLGLFGAAYATRLVRDEVAAALVLDHTRTARAKGASRFAVARAPRAPATRSRRSSPWPGSTSARAHRRGPSSWRRSSAGPGWGWSASTPCSIGTGRSFWGPSWSRPPPSCSRTSSWTSRTLCSIREHLRETERLRAEERPALGDAIPVSSRHAILVRAAREPRRAPTVRTRPPG